MCTENYMHSVSDHSKLIIANKYKCKEKVNRASKWHTWFSLWSLFKLPSKLWSRNVLKGINSQGCSVGEEKEQTKGASTFLSWRGVFREQKSWSLWAYPELGLKLESSLYFHGCHRVRDTPRDRENGCSGSGGFQCVPSLPT